MPDLTADPGLIADAVAVVLPGVGAFGACMAALRRNGLEEPVLDAVASGRPFLGVCIGTQMLFERERGGSRRRAGSASSPASCGGLPHGVKRSADAVEPYRRRPARRGDVPRSRRAAVVLLRPLAARRPRRSVTTVVATCEYGGTLITPRSGSGNVFATQFHPEKSAAAGLGLLGELRGVAARPGMKPLYPSIDLRGGHVVRLRQGDYADETIYGDDAVAVATAFVEQGAAWIHVVDLDAACTGEPRNRPLVGCRRGCRRRASAGADRRGSAVASTTPRRWPRAGVARVVMGSAAVQRPELVDEVAAVVPVAVGLDHRRGELAVHGWTESQRRHPRRRHRSLPGGVGVRRHRHRSRRHCSPVRTSRGSRPSCRRRTSRSSPAAGSARSTTSPRSPAIDGLHGIITGRALYEGRFTVAEAIEVLRVIVARVIPCLDVTAGRVVKGTNFVDLRDAGDPVELAARYDAEGADELVFLDITASSDDRDTMVDVVYRTAEQVYIPFTVGGGIRTADDATTHAARRCRQGQREHRRRPAARADRRDRHRVRGPVRRLRDRRQAPRRRIRGVPPRWTHADRHRRRRVGGRRRRSGAPARSC